MFIAAMTPRLIILLLRIILLIIMITVMCVLPMVLPFRLLLHVGPYKTGGYQRQWPRLISRIRRRLMSIFSLCARSAARMSPVPGADGSDESIALG